MALLCIHNWYRHPAVATLSLLAGLLLILPVAILFTIPEPQTHTFYHDDQYEVVVRYATMATGSDSYQIHKFYGPFYTTEYADFGSEAGLRQLHSKADVEAFLAKHKQ